MSSLNADDDRTAWVVQDVCTRAYCTRIWRLSRREGSLCYFCSHLPLASLDSLPLCALACCCRYRPACRARPAGRDRSAVAQDFLGIARREREAAQGPGGRGVKTEVETNGDVVSRERPGHV